MARASLKMFLVGKYFSVIVIIAVIIVMFRNAFLMGQLEEGMASPVFARSTAPEIVATIRRSSLICAYLTGISVASYIISEKARPALEWNARSCRVFLIWSIVLGALLVPFYMIGGIFGLIHLGQVRAIERIGT